MSMSALTVAAITATIHAHGTFTVEQVKGWATDYALHHALDVGIYLRQIGQESKFRYDLVNYSSLCYGPGQLHPMFYPTSEYSHPKANLAKSASIMRSYLDRYGSYDKALVAYNWGPRNLDNLLAEHPVTWREHIPEESKYYLKIILPQEEPMAPTSSRLGWHVQNIGLAPWLPRIVNELAGKLDRPLYVKVIDPPPYNLFGSNVRVIGRVWIGGDQEEQGHINTGTPLEYISRCLNLYERAPYVWAWEGPNEPPVATEEQRKRLNDFLAVWSVSMHGRDLRTVAGCLSVGQPDKEADILDLKDAVIHSDYWAVHEYSAPDMQANQPWYCLRYRTHILEPLKAIGITPQLLITETGIDGGVADKPGQGWKAYGGLDAYYAQLRWYDGELRKDAEVVAALPFTTGPENTWASFDVNEELSRRMADYILATEPVIAAPMPEPHEIREVAWNHLYVLPIAYNPTAALPAYARLKDLGVPTTPELVVKGATVQGFGKAIAFCRTGEWGAIKELAW